MEYQPTVKIEGSAEANYAQDPNLDAAIKAMIASLPQYVEEEEGLEIIISPPVSRSKPVVRVELRQQDKPVEKSYLQKLQGWCNQHINFEYSKRINRF